MSDQRLTILWLNSLLITLTFTATCSRAGRRIFVVRKFSWHDALIILAAVSATAFSIFQMVGTSLGWGQHIADVDPASLIKLRKLVMASNTFYFLCNWAVKHALLFFYSEITTERSHRISIYIMHFVAFGFGLSSILVNILQCLPITKVWNVDAPGRCVNRNAFVYYNSIMMMATDLVLYIIPVIFTWKLQLRRPQRIGLNCLFALGGLVLAASAARIYSVYLFATKPDFTYRFANTMIWAVIENHIAIVVACAPSIKVIALVLFPRLASSISKLRSLVTPSSTRSRASMPLEIVGLESGTARSEATANSDKQHFSSTESTPLPSPALTVDTRVSRASRRFMEWRAFRTLTSAGSERVFSPSSDSLEDAGLVVAESVPGKDGIRVEHSIRVEREWE